MENWETTWLSPHKPKLKAKRKHEEDDEQTKVCVYLEKRGCLFYAIPNGGRRNMLEAVRLKRTGVKAGVYDLCIAEPFGVYHGLYIEMKKLKGGVVSDVQKWWGVELKKRGYRAEVCKGAKEAIAVIEDYFRDSVNLL